MAVERDLRSYGMHEEVLNIWTFTSPMVFH
jgi:hypothetical protein